MNSHVNPESISHDEIHEDTLRHDPLPPFEIPDNSLAEVVEIGEWQQPQAEAMPDIQEIPDIEATADSEAMDDADFEQQVQALIPHVPEEDQKPDYSADVRMTNHARNNPAEFEKLYKEFYGFIRLKASNYFLIGGSPDDLIQEASFGFFKAVRDYNGEKNSSFRNFAELCISRQIITAIKTSTRNKHMPLNQYVSFEQPMGDEEGDQTFGESLPSNSPSTEQVLMSREGMRSLLDIIGMDLTQLEYFAVKMSMEGYSYEQIAEEVGEDTKTVDNALQRVKKKLKRHMQNS